MEYKGHRDLNVYKIAFELAMIIFEMSKTFPKEERYSLTDQIRRSSRSVSANIAEGFRKRQYPKMFANKLSDADGEATETQVWIDFAFRCHYLSEKDYVELIAKYNQIGGMLGRMLANTGKFVPNKSQQ